MAMLLGAADLAEYIARNYPGRVVEVGVGHVLDVAVELKARGLVVEATDRAKRHIGGMKIQEDDVFSPRMELYQGAGLIYSIRPPLEMQLAIGCLARQVGADVLIRPLQDEIADLPGFARRLVNAGEARFYLFELLH
ncbi:Uncharacterised protein [uncultured archaeon]|nr:Uncharacterised protein [uncultured archaeon]